MEKIQYGQYVVPSSDIIVNFGVGQPSNNELPLNIIKDGCRDMLELNDKSLLQYGDIPGYLEFRKVLSSFLEKRYKGATEKLPFSLGYHWRDASEQNQMLIIKQNE